MIATDQDAYAVLQVHPRAHQMVLQAAYRALAALYHPDRDPSDAATRRMATLNDAYARVRTHDRRAQYDRERERRDQTVLVVSATASAGDNGRRDRSVIDFGRYNGWSIFQVAQRDPDYLLWLSRHSSGLRYRGHIERVLNEVGARAPAGPPKAREARRKRAWHR